MQIVLAYSYWTFLSFLLAKFNQMRNCPNTYYITVIVDTELDLVIGAGTIVIEQKFIHDCGVVSAKKRGDIFFYT